MSTPRHAVPALRWHVKDRKVCFPLHKYNYMIKQLAKDGSCEGGFPWQAKAPRFWLLEATSRRTSHRSAHRIDACALIHTSCLHKSLQTWNLTPCHGYFTNSSEKPGCLAALSNPWSIISTFGSYTLQIFKSSRVLRQRPRARWHLRNGQLGQLQRGALQPGFRYWQDLSDISTRGRSVSTG